MDKKEIVRIVLKNLEQERSSLESEGPNEDSQVLDTSYLDGANHKRLSEIQDAIVELNGLSIRDYSGGKPIDLTALVEVTIDDTEKRWYMFLPKNMGKRVAYNGHEIYTLTLESPLGKKLKGLSEGDGFDFKVQDEYKSYEINKVY